MAELMDATLLVCGLSDLLSLSLKTQQSSISGLLVFLLCVMISQRSQAVGLPLHLRVLPVSTVESRRARDVNPADNWSLTCSPVPYLKLQILFIHVGSSVPVIKPVLLGGEGKRTWELSCSAFYLLLPADHLPQQLA